MPVLTPTDVYVDGAVLDVANYNTGNYSATAADGRYSVLNGQIEAANLDSKFNATKRMLQPMQGPRAFNSEGRLTKSYYNDYTHAASDEDLFPVHGIALAFDVPRVYPLCMWQVGFFLSHWRGFVSADPQNEGAARGEVQDLRYRLTLDGTPLEWTTRGLGTTARINQNITTGDLDIYESVHSRYAHISHLQNPVGAGRHWLELRVYMKNETVNDTTSMSIADNDYDVEVDYYSRLTFGFHNVLAMLM